ncbi:MAG: hypothetical protein Q8K33_01405 [Cypionkella sp.]|uniref:hypothetical protein n=1 Tax=Cypionkella sp. TaxID=2811411 RepID=UPI002731D0FA|nr:hypothetical protein [Cypionkella sp.]MDP2047537.1 hypothetical protein [Cypionkella sp.]
MSAGLWITAGLAAVVLIIAAIARRKPRASDLSAGQQYRRRQDWHKSSKPKPEAAPSRQMRRAQERAAKKGRANE